MLPALPTATVWVTGPEAVEVALVPLTDPEADADADEREAEEVIEEVDPWALTAVMAIAARRDAMKFILIRLCLVSAGDCSTIEVS